MRSQISPKTLDQVVAFHGHLCPGLTFGVRVAEVVLRELGARSEDEELVAIVETDSCGVDAIQVLVGCTFGKGNLIHLDHGQNAYTFARRSDGRVLRIVARVRPERRDEPEDEALAERVRTGDATPAERRACQELFRQRALDVLQTDEQDLLSIEELVDYTPPARAQVVPSVRCEGCGRLTMATRLEVYEGKRLCTVCLEEASSSRLVLRPIGVIHNELVPREALPRATSESSTIALHTEYVQGLQGIQVGDVMWVLFAFGTESEPAPLLQHRRGDPNEPVRGVFALRSPRRPNPIGLTQVTVLGVEGGTLTVSGLDAWDGTAVLDIKPV
ncbi:MAG: TrmO family methyltransferase domain-containing protein [Anaerolineae bacterium]